MQISKCTCMCTLSFLLYARRNCSTSRRRRSSPFLGNCWQRKGEFSKLYLCYPLHVAKFCLQQLKPPKLYTVLQTNNRHMPLLEWMMHSKKYKMCYCDQKSILLFRCISKLCIWTLTEVLSLHFQMKPVNLPWESWIKDKMVSKTH